MVAGALADDNGVAHAVGDAGDVGFAVAIKQAIGGRAYGAGQAVVADAARIKSAGVVKDFHPTVAANVIALRHGSDWVGEGTVIDREGFVEIIRRTLKNRQRLLGDLHVHSDSHSHVEIDLVIDVALFDVRQQ